MEPVQQKYPDQGLIPNHPLTFENKTEIPVFVPPEMTQEQKIGELERSNRELEEFAYAVSHDLQEPLRKIYTFSEKLLSRIDEIGDKESSDYLTRIINITTQMRSLIDSLLDLSRISHGKPLFREFEIDQIIEEARNEIDLRKTNASITISKDCSVKLECLPEQMRQMFCNIISNAVKFQQPGKVPEINIDCTELDQDEKNKFQLDTNKNFHKITVKDNGIGFEQQYAERIFKPFLRLHTKSQYPGSGVGLAICRKIMDLHKGLIFAEGFPGEGAVFTIILPESQQSTVSI